ncbi:MAG: hypothetical protein GC162_16255 [Planctomycetes bacterium]|nr:hypothetical protein [Planctomycetota bacterium]
MLRFALCTSVCALAVAFIHEAALGANGFLPAVSTATVTHTPDILNLALQDADGSPTFPKTTNILSVLTNSKPPLDLTSTFTDGASVSVGKAGVAQFNTFPSTNGYATATFAAGIGVSQTDGSSKFAGASTMKLSVDLSWDISDGWTGPRIVYELLGVALKTSAAGDVASVTGDFTFHIDLNSVGSPGDDMVKSVHLEDMVKDGASKNSTLYASTLLTTKPITKATAGEKHIFRITGDWVFSALDPVGGASCDSLDFDGPDGDMLFQDFISQLTMMDPEFVMSFTDINDLRMGGGGAVRMIPAPKSAGMLALIGALCFVAHRPPHQKAHA